MSSNTCTTRPHARQLPYRSINVTYSSVRAPDQSGRSGPMVGTPKAAKLWRCTNTRSYRYTRVRTRVRTQCTRVPVLQYRYQYPTPVYTCTYRYTCTRGGIAIFQQHMLPVLEYVHVYPYMVPVACYDGHTCTRYRNMYNIYGTCNNIDVER